jgi:Ca2+-binding EF-hand superfamily protein
MTEIESDPHKRREKMKKLVVAAALVASVALLVAVSFAQGPGRGEGRKGEGGLALRVFDTNGDGQIGEREWLSVFEKIDKDGDGILSKEELEESRREAREEARKRMFERFDADGSGTISREEFPGPDERFAGMDTNSDGELSPEETKDAAVKMRGMRERQAGRWMLNRLDADASGTISKEEFPWSDERFALIDENGNGEISPEELKAAAAKRREMMEEHPELGPHRMFHQRRKWRDDNAVE